MSVETTYTNARANFARFCDVAAENREVVLIRRRGADDVALVAAAELESLLETAHLLRSPRNAERLLSALAGARESGGTSLTLAELRQEVGLGEEG